MPGLYIHIPFCKQLCSYCDFYFSVSLARTQEMLDCLIKEMEIKAMAGQALPNNGKPLTLYFGGGTPTVYSVAEIKKLADTAMSLFFAKPPEEWTVEANPDDLTVTYLTELKNAGVNRLSIGIQSFINRDLEIMKRRHSATQGTESVLNAQKAGFNNISIDLIYGFPGMSVADWEYNIDHAIELGVQHISAYHLSIEPKTIFGKMVEKGNLAPIDDELSASQYELLRNKLSDAGYIHYEISNFALPGFHSRHNSSYWDKQPYIGIGPSAHSYNGKNIRTNNVANNIKYIEDIQKNIIPEDTEILSEKDCYNESLIVSLRTSNGLNINSLPDYYKEFFLRKIQKHLLSGFVVLDTTYKIPAKHFLISDSIIADLIE